MIRNVLRPCPILAGLLLASCVARAAPIDCAAAADPVERAICATPTLLDADRRVATGFDRRLAQCAPRQRSAFGQTQKFWLRDRNACLSLLSDTDDALERCVAARLDERIAQLERIGDGCDLDAVAGEYRYVDPGYLKANASRYLGRVVAVFGSLRPATCDVRLPDLAGRIMSLGARIEDFPVRFKSMWPERREALCAQNPASHWSGVVRRAGGRFYLDLNVPAD